MNNNKYKEKSSLLDKRKKELKRKATPSELKIKNQLKRISIRAMFQKGFIAGNFCIVDFYIPKYRICLEVDGGYHLSDKQKKRDQDRDQYLILERGLSVIHITNELANTIDDENLLYLITKCSFTKKAFYYKQ
jgi:very-short-patch-repair endonuclease